MFVTCTAKRCEISLKITHGQREHVILLYVDAAERGQAREHKNQMLEGYNICVRVSVSHRDRD